MIIVTVTKIDANTGEHSELNKLIITNDGTGTNRRGNYNVRLQSRSRDDVTAYVRGHWRADGVLKLLHSALEAEGGKAIGAVRR